MPALLAVIVFVVLAVVLVKLMLWAAGVVIALVAGVIVYFLAEKLVGKGN